jgi:triphosphoribosyl-dephospho-CoA synthase
MSPAFASQKHGVFVLSKPAVRQLHPAAIGALATACLNLEIATFPKPGLVSHVDQGSHKDMDADMFYRSAAALRPYFSAMVEAGRAGCDMEPLRCLGLEAEAAMFAATGGVNTHRGAIFGLGLLCAAAGVKAAGGAPLSMSLGAIVSHFWRNEILRGPMLLHSHGAKAARLYGAQGARQEAASGFPHVYTIGLPALLRTYANTPKHTEAVRVEACFALIATLQDTNLLHRGGLAGLQYAQQEARQFLAAGGVRQLDWRKRAENVHQRFTARNLSPGGSADLLAMSLFAQAFETMRGSS